MSMNDYLIRNTTREQREAIVREALGGDAIGCDAIDGYEMYLPYIDGTMELRDITMNYRANYQKSMDAPVRGECGYNKY